MNWKHRWLNADNPWHAFEGWLTARWPHPFEGHWVQLAVDAYAEDDEVPREMAHTPPKMPDDPF